MFIKLAKRLLGFIAACLAVVAAGFVSVAIIGGLSLLSAGAHAGAGVWPGGIGLLDVIAHYYPLATSVVGTAAIAAALTPNTFDNKIVAFLRCVLDFFAANFLNAKNENKPR